MKSSFKASAIAAVSFARRPVPRNVASFIFSVQWTRMLERSTDHDCLPSAWLRVKFILYDLKGSASRSVVKRLATNKNIHQIDYSDRTPKKKQWRTRRIEVRQLSWKGE